MQKFVLVGCILLALTACSNPVPNNGSVTAGTISDVAAAKEIISEGAMPMKAGEWEETASFNQVEAPGYSPKDQAIMKADALKGEVNRTCWTEEDAAKPNIAHFGGGGQGGCTITALDRSGNNVKWAFSCKSGVTTIIAAMNGSYAAESYTLIADQTITSATGGPVRMRGKIESKRIGECPK